MEYSISNISAIIKVALRTIVTGAEKVFIVCPTFTVNCSRKDWLGGYNLRIEVDEKMGGDICEEGDNTGVDREDDFTGYQRKS